MSTELPRPLSAQKLFNTVAKHLLTQGVPSKNMSGLCSYRGENGTKCAIGCLIPDSEYKSVHEGMSVNTLIQYVPYIKALIGENQKLARALQLIHDRYSPDTWPNRLRERARNSKLKYKCLSGRK